MIDVSAFVTAQQGKSIAVFGLGQSGLSVVKALCAAGGSVLAWDDRSEPRDKAAAMGARISELTPNTLSECGILVLAPGVPLHFPAPHVVVDMARDAGLEIICDIEILGRINHGRRTIGITGTNGKSTSVSLMHHTLKSAGVDAALGGNIGVAVLDTDMPSADGCFVIELSSYQLDLCPTFSPDISVLLNITPDHIDRHGSLQGYAEAKARIFRGAGTAIIGVDDKPSCAVFDDVSAAGERNIFPISVTQKPKGGVYVSDGVLVDNRDSTAQQVGDMSDAPVLSGAHNHQNAAAVYAALREFGLTSDQIIEGFKTFGGLAHRQYPVRTINAVRYINDSKATNAEATSKALSAYDNIFWIAGGQAKDGGLDGLDDYMPRIRHTFLIGEAANDFAAWLNDRGGAYTICNTLDKAALAAHDMAQSYSTESEAVVLLSPACASWDQFKSFEDRGNQFTAQVNAFSDGDAA